MKKIDKDILQKLQGGICTLPPNENVPFQCLDACQIASALSGGNYPLACFFE